MLDYLRAHAVRGTYGVGDRVLVAVGDNDTGAEVVRAGKRLADSLGAPWTAVHIETPHRMAQSQTLEASLHLATQLGAQVITLSAGDVVDGLLQIAGELRATVLVLGATGKQNLWNRLWRSQALHRRLLASDVHMALHVIATRPSRPAGALANRTDPASGRHRPVWRFPACSSPL
jgi:two-component system sensor histidine kinase KdpD